MPIPSFDNAVVSPPSLAPQIASLGTMIDTFARRRMELQQQQDQAAAAQAELDRKMAWDKEKEEYGRRKLDIAEKKADADANYKRAQATQASIKEAKSAIARGQHPGTMLIQGPDGNPAYVDWKFVGGQPQVQPQGQPTPQTPPVGGPPIMNMPFALAQRRLPPPVASATPNGAVQTNDAELESLMSRAEQPPQPQASPNTIFLDRNDEGEATGLMGQDGGQQVKLPLESFPPNAREGQTFNANDVNLKGGKGNPFAEPLPPTNDIEDLQGNLEQPESSTLMVPSREVRGVSMQMPTQEHGRWEARLPDGQVITVDPEEARAAHRDDVAAQLREVDTALADPATGMNPQIAQYLAIKKRSLLADLSPAEIKQVYGQAATMERVQSQEASREKIAAGHDETRRATAKYGRIRGTGSKTVPAQASGEGSAFSRLAPKDQARIEGSINSGINSLDREMNWSKLEGVGFDRLDLALQNIRAKGELGGVQQMEAMMNFFGYIRGGVPAKNETDEFKHVTGNLWTMLDNVGKYVGVRNLGSGWSGSEADKAALQKGLGQMPQAQRAGLEQAIVESKKVVEKVALKNVYAQAEAYKTASLPFQERAQDKLNAKLRFAGFKPVQFYSSVPLTKDFEAPTEQAAPAPAPTQGKLSDQQLLEALKGLK